MTWCGQLQGALDKPLADGEERSGYAMTFHEDFMKCLQVRVYDQLLLRVDSRAHQRRIGKLNTASLGCAPYYGDAVEAFAECYSDLEDEFCSLSTDEWRTVAHSFGMWDDEPPQGVPPRALSRTFVACMRPLLLC